ncbi:hypothetical protein BJ742DRAFT_825142 [Cladochytrium replicatum]|nr:hypothetical protein BJ742DRAFT_825142 [Cladochytrium replicatum]
MSSSSRQNTTWDAEPSTSRPQRIRTRPLVGAPSPPPPSRSGTPTTFTRTASPAQSETFRSMSRSNSVASISTPPPPGVATARLVSPSPPPNSSRLGMSLASNTARLQQQQQQPTHHLQQHIIYVQPQRVYAQPTPNQQASKPHMIASPTPLHANNTPHGIHAPSQRTEGTRSTLSSDDYDDTPLLCAHCRGTLDQDQESMPIEAQANDRVLRKIMDLEISNTSLMAVNASLENTIRKQAQTIEKLRARMHSSNDALFRSGSSLSGIDDTRSEPALSKSPLPSSSLKKKSDFTPSDYELQLELSDLATDDGSHSLLTPLDVAVTDQPPTEEEPYNEEDAYNRLCGKMQQLIAEASAAMTTARIPLPDDDLEDKNDPTYSSSYTRHVSALWHDDDVVTATNTPISPRRAFPYISTSSANENSFGDLDSPHSTLATKLQSTLSSVLEVRQQALAHDRVVAGVQHKSEPALSHPIPASDVGSSVTVSRFVYDQMLELLNEVKVEAVLAGGGGSGSQTSGKGWSDLAGAKPAPARGGSGARGVKTSSLLGGAAGEKRTPPSGMKKERLLKGYRRA